MNAVTPSQVLDFFLKNKQESENYLAQYGNSGKDRNIGVTLSYDHIAQNDPLFIWFAAAALGSNQVGKIINLIDKPVLTFCDDTVTLSKGFSYGNQTIHNNITALYYIYKDYGLDLIPIKWTPNYAANTTLSTLSGV